MIIVNILTSKKPIKRGFNDYYPLIKWRNEFKDSGMKFRFIYNHNSKNIEECDILIYDYRYASDNIKRGRAEDLEPIIVLFDRMRDQNIKVILFDTGDSAGSRCFSLTSHVDLHLKKQLFKDLSKYTINQGKKSVMPWLPDDKFTKNNNYIYIPCPEEQLHKLKIAWNIAMVDYRRFPFADILPVGTSYLFNKLYEMPAFIEPSESRNIITSFRGTLGNNDAYAHQRNKILNLLISMNKSSIIGGGKVSKKKYYDELKNTKMVISPFGWGEICYRDFESIIFGCLLLKPDVSHIDTYPDIFSTHTYIPVKWDLSNLEEKIVKSNENYKQNIEKIINSQNILINYMRDYNYFINRFKGLILFDK